MTSMPIHQAFDWISWSLNLLIKTIKSSKISRMRGGKTMDVATVKNRKYGQNSL